MTASFAGSRFLGERRRRRLATESDDQLIKNGAVATDDRPAAVTADDVSQRSAMGQFPLRKVISQKIWKHWAVAFLGLALGAGMLYCGHRSAELGEKLGPGFARLFNLSDGPVYRCYRSILLILSGQLALLILWARSGSLQDFAGRYRLWIWVAGAWFCFAFCTASGAHHAWSETVLWLWNADLPHCETLCWLAPAAVLGSVLLWMLHRDMRGCRSSSTMLWLAAGLLTTAGVQTLLSNTSWTELTQPAIAMGGVLCLFASMLLHARHVVYRSAEPPPLRPFRLPIRFSIRLPRIRFPQLRLPSLERKQKRAAASADDESPSSTTKTKAPSKSVTRRRKGAASQPATEKPTDKSGSTARRDTAECAESPRDIRIDQPIDSELLKGLSKRERRRLRKQWREQQRDAIT